MAGTASGYRPRRALVGLGAMRSVLGAALRAPGAVLRALGAVLGEGAYPAYLTHHRAAHPGVPPLDERTFWRERYRAQDLSPAGRCC